MVQKARIKKQSVEIERHSCGGRKAVVVGTSFKQVSRWTVECNSSAPKCKKYKDWDITDLVKLDCLVRPIKYNFIFLQDNEVGGRTQN